MIQVVHPGSGSWIRILIFTHLGSRIQGSKRHRIPDPDPQHLFQMRRFQLGDDAVDLQAIYDRIWEAKCRTDHLTPHQLLRRDLKCIKDQEVQ